MSQPLNPDGRTWIPTEYEAGCAEEPVWIVLEKRQYLASTGV